MTWRRLADPAGRLREIDVVREARLPEPPRLSVIVPSYNTARFVAATLASLFAQSIRALEVIAVDDGSSDDSIDVLGRVDDARLTVVRQANRGLAGSRNTGLLLARADAVGFCDADDVWFACKAERHLALLAAEPRVGLTFSYSAYLSEDGRPTGAYLISRCRAPSALALTQRNHVGNGSTVVARRELFRLAGLFDESLGSCEDIEMWVRAAGTPYAMRLVPEVLTGYRVRAGSMSTTYDAFLLGYRRALARWRASVPGFTPRLAARSYAECLRIASRKAFADGDVGLSRRLLGAALRQAPSLPLRDLRAAGLLALHLAALPLPPSRRRHVYGAAARALRIAYRAMPGLTGNPPYEPIPM